MMTDVDVTRAEPVMIMNFGRMFTRISEGVKYKKKRDDNNKKKHDDKNTEKHDDTIKGKEIRSSMIRKNSDTITGSSNSTETSSWRSWQEHLHVVCDWVGKDHGDCVHDAEKSVKADDDKKLRRKQSIPECRGWWDYDNEKSMSCGDGERKFKWEQHNNALLWRDSRTGADRKYNDDDEDNHEEKDKRVSTDSANGRVTQKNEAKIEEQHDDDGRKKLFRSALTSVATSVRKVHVSTRDMEQTWRQDVVQCDLEVAFFLREGIRKVSEAASVQSGNTEQLHDISRKDSYSVDCSETEETTNEDGWRSDVRENQRSWQQRERTIKVQERLEARWKRRLLWW